MSIARRNGLSKPLPPQAQFKPASPRTFSQLIGTGDRKIFPPVKCLCPPFLMRCVAPTVCAEIGRAWPGLIVFSFHPLPSGSPFHQRGSTGLFSIAHTRPHGWLLEVRPSIQQTRSPSIERSHSGRDSRDRQSPTGIVVQSFLRKRRWPMNVDRVRESTVVGKASPCHSYR